MSVTAKFKSVAKKKLNTKAVRRHLETGIKKLEGAAQRKELAQTTRTWHSEKPTFETELQATGDKITVTTGPAGSEKAVKKWQYLNEGTRTRWALMSSDWRSKTAPGQLRSGSGGGRVLIAGRRAMQARGIGPRPGIKARGWTELIQQRRKGPFRDLVIVTFGEALQKLYD